jgi:hypothetical protein
MYVAHGIIGMIAMRRKDLAKLEVFYFVGKLEFPRIVLSSPFLSLLGKALSSVHPKRIPPAHQHSPVETSRW